MGAIPFETGQVVRSTAGHDQGQCFVILSVLDDQYVLIANGSTRKVSCPKKKKIKHLKIGPFRSEMVRERMQSRGIIYDHEIRKLLEPYSAFKEPHKEG